MTERYYCKKCAKIEYFDTRCKRHKCYKCGYEMSYLSLDTIIDGTLYEPSYNKNTIIPEGVIRTEIGAFKDRYSLETVICPSTFEEVSSGCFSDCDNIKFITLSDKIKSIENYAFDCFIKRYMDTKGFKVIALTESVTKISDNAFGNSVNDDTLFLVPKGSYAEKYVKKTNRRYKIYNSSVSFLSTENTHNGVLYRAQTDQKEQTIEEGVNEIASFVFEDDCKLESVTFPKTLKKIEEYAFKGCKQLNKIVFNDNLKEIGSKAFYDVDIKYIELPGSINVLAPDAFNTKKCIISIDGKMPEYAKKSKEIETLKLTIDSKKDDLGEVTKQLLIHKEDVANNQCAIDSLNNDIQNEQNTLNALVLNEADLNEKLKNTILDFNAKISSIDSKIESLESLRRHTFFLALSKKKQYESDIAIEKEKRENAKNEMNSIQEDFNIKFNEIEQNKKSIALNGSKLSDIVKILDKKNRSIRDQIAILSEKEINLKNEVTAAEEELNEKKNELDKANAQWMEKFNKVKAQVAEEQKAAAERLAEKLRLENEQKRIAKLNKRKSALLSKLILPTEKVSEHISTLGFLPEANLLGDEYNLVEDNKIKRDYIEAVNDYIDSNADKLEEIYDINNQLNIEKDNGVEQFFKQEIPDIKNPVLPERILRLSNAFKDNPYWKNFKKAMKECTELNNTQNDFLGKFFSDVDLIRYDNKYFLEDFYSVFKPKNFNAIIFLPYFIVFFDSILSKNLYEVYAYNKIYILDRVIYAEVETTTEYTKYNGYCNTSVFGEVIYTKFRYTKSNGEPDLRYSFNPLDKEIRYSRVVIRDEKITYASFPAKTLELAEKVCDAFNEFTDYVSNGPLKAAYEAVCDYEDTESIEREIANAIKAEKKLAKQKAQAEEEEKKRIKEERLAAEREAKLEAERKKQELIERQRKINEERKREAEKEKEKQREIAKLFNDDYTNDNNDSVQDNSVDVSDENSLPVEIMDKHLISNTVFKVNLSLRADCSNGPITAYFVDCENKLISNRKKLSADDGENIQLGFVFVSGIDYSAMSKCYLEFETPTEKLGKIAFDVNISFSPDEF